MLEIKRIEQLAEYPEERVLQIFLAICALTRQTFGVAGQPQVIDCQRRKCKTRCPFKPKKREE